MANEARDGGRNAYERLRELVRRRWTPGQREQSVTAEDLVQTVYRRLLSHYPALDPEVDGEQFDRLAARILTSRLVERHRHEHGRGGKGGCRRVPFDEAEHGGLDAGGVEEEVDRRALLDELRRFERGEGPVAAAIPDAARRRRLLRILELTVVDGLTQREIAGRLEVSQQRVSQELLFVQRLFSRSREEGPR